MTLLLPMAGGDYVDSSEVIATENSFGDQAGRSLPTGIGPAGSQRNFLRISEGIDRVQSLPMVVVPLKTTEAVRGSIASDPLDTRVQAVVGELRELSDLRGVQRVKNAIKETPIIMSVDWNIYLDGANVTSRITAQISINEASVHNSIQLSSSDTELFRKADPSNMSGTPRILVLLGLRPEEEEEEEDTRRVLGFLLEERSGGEDSFTLWGRSKSAKYDSPHAEDIDIVLSEPALASDVAKQMIPEAWLQWDVGEWPLPEDFEFKGSPIEGVVRIAQIIGAIVRCTDEGMVQVRNRFPVRPIDMGAVSSSRVAVSYGRDEELIKLNYEQKKGTGYNMVEVRGEEAEIELPYTEIEESSPVISQLVHIRVYWQDREPDGAELDFSYVTSGTIESLGTFTETKEEVVVFAAGTATASYPITTFTDVEWLGDVGGDITFRTYSKVLTTEIIVDGEEEEKVLPYRIGRITYVTTYQRYELDGSDVEVLLALLSITSDPDVAVRVVIDPADYQAPDIVEPFLGDEASAVSRGTAWLDANKYDYNRIVLTAPYQKEAIDGALAYIDDAEVDCFGNYHIRRADIIFDGPRVINGLEVIQCQVS